MILEVADNIALIELSAKYYWLIGFDETITPFFKDPPSPEEPTESEPTESCIRLWYNESRLAVKFDLLSPLDEKKMFSINKRLQKPDLGRRGP